MIKVLRSNYRYWINKPTREYTSFLTAEAWYRDWNAEVKRALDAIPTTMVDVEIKWNS